MARLLLPTSGEEVIRNVVDIAGFVFPGIVIIMVCIMIFRGVVFLVRRRLIRQIDAKLKALRQAKKFHPSYGLELNIYIDGENKTVKKIVPRRYLVVTRPKSASATNRSKSADIATKHSKPSDNNAVKIFMPSDINAANLFKPSDNNAANVFKPSDKNAANLSKPADHNINNINKSEMEKLIGAEYR